MGDSSTAAGGATGADAAADTGVVAARGQGSRRSKHSRLFNTLGKALKHVIKASSITTKALRLILWGSLQQRGGGLECSGQHLHHWWRIQGQLPPTQQQQQRMSVNGMH